MPPSGMKNQVEEAKNTSIKNHLLVLPYKRERKKYCGAMVITIAQPHSRKPERRFFAVSNPARGVLEICSDEGL